MVTLQGNYVILCLRDEFQKSTTMILVDPMGLPTCQFGLEHGTPCGFKCHWMGDHVTEAHQIGILTYLAKYPGATTVSKELESLRLETPTTRSHPRPENLTITVGGLKFPVNFRVPESACLPMPKGYRIPVFGPLASDIQDVLIALKRRRSVWIWGLPGTGKDALISAYCSMTRTPSLLFGVVQGADIQSWRFTRAFDSHGTRWEEGLLLKSARDGFKAPDGSVHPYLINLSDFDRATRQQAEELRLITDSIQGRISGPAGEVYPVLPGTILVATANTSGGGDSTGRSFSSNPIDPSILDRFERKVQFHSLDPKDEEPILVGKFPRLAATYPKAIPSVIRATTSVRKAIESQNVFCEWSHRAVCAWVSAAQDLVDVLGPSASKDLLSRSVRVVLDGLPNEDTRDAVVRLLDPHIKGGVIPEGATNFIKKTPLK